MTSKILIDVEEQGCPIIRIIRKITLSPERGGQELDVRDKLVDRFIEGATFAIITHSGERDVEIYSMGPMDVLENILSMHKRDDDKNWSKEFEQAIFKVASMLEKQYGMKSTAFLDKCKAQSLISGNK